ncbi:MAG: helix-turn-helix transcriptional regulator [Solobacterium sp.]|nr:helix-turn-helix transcriptional regulator [Solobacterium sp.]
MNKEKLNAAIGASLKNARKQRRMTQEQVADAVGISRSVLTRYELGSIELSMPMFVAICEAIGVNYAEILEGIDASK